jgi:hypothetical protein
VVARKYADARTHEEVVTQDYFRVFASPDATQVIDVRIFTQVDILRISDGSRGVDSDIFLGMDVGSPDYLLVDVVGKTVY